MICLKLGAPLTESAQGRLNCRDSLQEVGIWRDRRRQRTAPADIDRCRRIGLVNATASVLTAVGADRSLSRTFNLSASAIGTGLADTLNDTRR